MSTSSATSCRRTLAAGAALLGCSLLSAHASAAIVVIDLTSAGTNGVDISGINGGVAVGTYIDVPEFVPGGRLQIYNDFMPGSLNYRGFDAENGPGGSRFQFATGGTAASPQNFGPNSSIAAASSPLWAVGASFILFTTGAAVSPDFGPNSFMGFRVGNDANGWKYGWIEILWDSTGTAVWNTTGAAAFKLVRAAYESDVNTAIMTPAAAGGVPLPGAAGLAACGLLAAGRRRRR